MFRLPSIVYSNWPQFINTRRCYSGGITVTFEKIVSFLAQLIVYHESRRIQLLFTVSSLWPFVRQLPICAWLRPELFGVLSTVAYGNRFFLMSPLFTIKTLYAKWCVVVKAWGKNSTQYIGMLDERVVPSTTASIILLFPLSLVITVQWWLGTTNSERVSILFVLLTVLWYFCFLLAYPA